MLYGRSMKTTGNVRNVRNVRRAGRAVFNFVLDVAITMGQSVVALAVAGALYLFIGAVFF